MYNGGLYCNFEENVSNRFKGDIDAMVAAAEERWASYVSRDVHHRWPPLTCRLPTRLPTQYGSLQAGPFNVGCMADCHDDPAANCKSDPMARVIPPPDTYK